MTTTTDDEQHDVVINPLTVEQMTDDQLDEALAARRERRLAYYEIYNAAQEQKRETKEGRLRDTLSKQLEMFKKELDRMDVLFEKMDARALKIRAVRLEITYD